MVPEGDRNELPPVVEGRGETLGKAKWAAVRELQEQFHGVTGENVSFEVIEDPEKGSGEAVVEATLDLEGLSRQRESRESASDPAEAVREIVSRVLHALRIRATLSVEEDEDELVVSVNGDDLGLFIGKGGHTIDAVQGIASQVAFRKGGLSKRVVVDAAGYRERRSRAVERQADEAASEAIRFRRPVELPPMRAAERRLVHVRLVERRGVKTHSEGNEPNRCVVVTSVDRRPAD